MRLQAFCCLKLLLFLVEKDPWQKARFKPEVPVLLVTLRPQLYELKKIFSFVRALLAFKGLVKF